MPRLLRPHIPLEVRCRVALAQLGELWPERVMDEAAGAYGALLDRSLVQLAILLNCDLEALRLDHNPALGAREKVFRKGVHVGYRPAANDPEYLIYREKHAHHIKTNVRGDGAQHPDRVLIKRERRREKKAQPVKRHPAKKPWAKRPMKAASQWPKGRKLQGRPFSKKGSHR